MKLAHTQCTRSQGGVKSRRCSAAHTQQRLKALPPHSSGRTTTTTSGSTTTAAPPPPSSQKSDEDAAVASLAISVALGAALSSAGVGLDPALPEAAQHLSAALGWSFFSAWSLSFWPQIIDVARTRDVSGLSADYLAYSAVGYGAYFAYTSALCLNEGVRLAYAAQHGGGLPDIGVADVAFAAHALFATLVLAGQYVAFRPRAAAAAAPAGLNLGGLSAPAAGVCVVSLAAAVAAAAAAGPACAAGECDGALPLLGLAGGLKVAMTMVKYSPQVLHNHKRRSTEGWSAANVLLDLSGGLMSLAQVAYDAAARGELDVVTGSPAKLAIAALSIAYDLVFIAQHYWWYGGHSGGNSGNSGNSGAKAAATTTTTTATGRQQQRRGAGAAAALPPPPGGVAAPVFAYVHRRAAPKKS